MTEMGIFSRFRVWREIVQLLLMSDTQAASYFCLKIGFALGRHVWREIRPAGLRSSNGYHCTALSKMNEYNMARAYGRVSADKQLPAPQDGNVVQQCWRELNSLSSEDLRQLERFAAFCLSVK